MEPAKDEVAAWVKNYTQDLYSYAQSKIADKESAEDVVQNTFLAAVESYSKFEHKSSPKTWLFAILKNKIADYLRQKYKQSNVSQSFDPLEVCFDKDGSWNPYYKPHSWLFDEKELLDNHQFNFVLKSCLEHLPAKWSSAVQLKYFYEDNSKEICDRLEITQTNFWQMIHRAKVMLRNCLEMNWFKKQNEN